MTQARVREITKSSDVPQRRIAGRKKKLANGNGAIAKLRVDTGEISRLQELGYSKPEIYDIVAPRRTLTRRIQQKDPLTLEESDRVKRLERIMEHAMRVLGSNEKANRWLRKPNRALDKAIPMELLVSETGAVEVENILNRIDYGMYS